MNIIRRETKSESSAPMIQTRPPVPTAAPPPSPPWTELPDDLTVNILKRLDAEEILECAQNVCSTWWRICKNPSMWLVIDLDFRRHEILKYGNFNFNCEVQKFKNICRCALDRSQGQLVELKIAAYGVDGLLNYIADRSSQLRRLELTEYNFPTTRDLILAIKKFPQLEELHVIKMPPLNVVDFESIGISCPTLKSFTYDNRWNDYIEFSEHAVAIGKTMPNLHNLRLCNQRMGNHALEAILDGCPHLESLELELCPGLDLRGSLGKRCSDQIKDLKFHPDSYDWDDDTDSSDLEHETFYHGDYDIYYY